MKTYISRGTGICKESTKVKTDPITRKVKAGQFNENKILSVESKKYWTANDAAANEFYADVFFIFIFPQRKITKAIKERK